MPAQPSLQNMSMGAVLLLVLGIVLSFVLAARSFQLRRVQFAGQPALPRYLTRPNLYVVGLVAYSALAGIFYLALILYWGPLSETFGPIFGDDNWIGQLLQKHGSGAPNQDLIPWLAAAVMLYLVRWESKYNPLLIMREFIFDAVSIPQRAVDVYQALRTADFRTLGDTEITEVLAAPTVTAVAAGDFKLNRNTVEYKWAHISYLFFRALDFAERQSYESLFGDDMLRWESIRADYTVESGRVAAWKSAVPAPHYTETLELIGTLDDLTQRLYRLLACVAVFGNGDAQATQSFVRDVTRALPAAVAVKDLTPYLLLFIASILVTILVGREVSVALYHGLIGPADDIVQFDAAKMSWWSSVSILLYMLPVALMFAFRCRFKRRFPFDVSRYWNLYIAFAALAFAIAALTLPTISGLARFDLGSLAYWSGVQREIPWCILPGLLCGYVAYQMDTPVRPRETRREILQAGLARFGVSVTVGVLVLGWAVLFTGVSASQGFVIVVTGALLVGVLGAMSRFRTS
jgi:hypothetical protein